MLKVPLYGWGYSQRRAIIMSWELTWVVFATICFPIDPIQMILSNLNEKAEGR